MLKQETLVHGDDVSDTITRVYDNTSEKTLSIQNEDSLDCDVDSLESVLLEHDLNHFLFVWLWVHGSLGQQNFALGRVNV